MHRRPRHAAIAGLLLAAVPPLLVAQPALTLTPRSNEAFVGEALELTLEIRNFRVADPPVAPEISGGALRQIGDKFESSEISIINGRRSESHTRTYTFELIPSTPGELVIPPFQVSADGQNLQTRPLAITVRPSDAADLFFVEISAGRSRLYVGQRVQVTMSIWVKPARWGAQVVPIGQMLRQIRPINFGPFPLQVDNYATRSRAVGDTAANYFVYEFTTTFVAEHPGPLEFREIEVGLDYPTPRGTRRLRARPQVAAAEVLPIPMEGRPAHFNGAVGLFDIKTSASPTSVRVGDPINLTIDVFGDGPLETLPPPLLAADAALTGSFRLPTEQLAGEVQDARRRFTLTIRPKDDRVTEIPAIEYPYFDPTAERFVVARSEPIALSVAPAAEITAPPPPSLAQPATDAATLETLDGLHDIETRENVLLATVAPVSPRLVLLTAATPAGAFLLAWAAMAWSQARAADPAGRRRRWALRAARRRLAEARQRPPRELAVEIRATLAGYLADRFGQPPARFAGPAAAEFLRSRGASPDTVAAWEAVAARCDEAAFAGGTDGVSHALCEQALRCLAVAEREPL